MELVVKWNKETVTVAASDSDSLDLLRSAIYSLTAVQPEKQKLIFKGKILKEGDATLKSLGLADVSSTEERADPHGAG